MSTTGYALGYLGGGLLLALNLLWIQKPAWFGFADAGQATRVSFLSVAVWWIVFSIPLMRRVPEPAVAAHGGRALRSSARRSRRSARDTARAAPVPAGASCCCSPS